MLWLSHVGFGADVWAAKSLDDGAAGRSVGKAQRFLDEVARSCAKRSDRGDYSAGGFTSRRR